MNSLVYICQLSIDAQQLIKNAVEEYLKSQGIYSESAVQNIMDGRLEDINTLETYDIYRKVKEILKIK